MNTEFLLNRKANVFIFKSGFQSIFIDGYRVEFETKLNKSSSPNKTKIIIYNLTESFKKIIEEKDLSVNLFVGYGDVLEQDITKLIFSGNVLKPKTKKEGADFLTILECGDAQNALVDTNLDKSYKSGTRLKDIIKDLLKELNIDFNENILNKLSNRKFNNGYTAEGNVKSNLDTLLKNEGYYFTVQNGQVIITKDEEIDENLAVVFNKETGLLDIPIKTDKGLEFKALINQIVKAGDTVKVQSEFLEIDSFYKVSNVTYKGDTRGNDWYIQVEALSV